MHLAHAAVRLLEGVVSAGSGIAQGPLTPRVQAFWYQHGRGRPPERRSRLRAVVLWRGQPGWREFLTEDPAEREPLLAAARRLSTDGAAGRSRFPLIVAGRLHVTEFDRPRWRLSALGHTFRIPRFGRRALVVMIDRMDGVGGPPAVTGTATAYPTLPPEFFDSFLRAAAYQAGVPLRRREDVLYDALAAHSAVRRFLDPAA